MAIPLLIAAQRTGHLGFALRAPMTVPSGYQSGGGRRGASAGLSLGLTGLMLAGLASALVVPEVFVHRPGKTTVINIPAEPEPTKTPPPPTAETPTLVDTPRIALPPTNLPPLVDDFPYTLPPPIGTGDPGPIIVRPADPPPVIRDPVLTGASRDPRFARDFQPPYPAARQREGTEGYCRVSVSVNMSGRVNAVRAVDCPDEAFFRATERQAMRHWRFRPATRDGVAVETTIEQNVRFQLVE